MIMFWNGFYKRKKVIFIPILPSPIPPYCCCSVTKWSDGGIALPQFNFLDSFRIYPRQINKYTWSMHKKIIVQFSNIQNYNILLDSEVSAYSSSSVWLPRSSLAFSPPVLLSSPRTVSNNKLHSIDLNLSGFLQRGTKLLVIQWRRKKQDRLAPV